MLIWLIVLKEQLIDHLEFNFQKLEEEVKEQLDQTISLKTLEKDMKQEDKEDKDLEIDLEVKEEEL